MKWPRLQEADFIYIISQYEKQIEVVVKGGVKFLNEITVVIW